MRTCILCFVFFSAIPSSVKASCWAYFAEKEHLVKPLWEKTWEEISDPSVRLMGMSILARARAPLTLEDLMTNAQMAVWYAFEVYGTYDRAKGTPRAFAMRVAQREMLNSIERRRERMIPMSQMETNSNHEKGFVFADQISDSRSFEPVRDLVALEEIRNTFLGYGKDDLIPNHLGLLLYNHSRIVYLLYEEMGIRQKEIGNYFGSTRAEVSVRLVRARRKLAKVSRKTRFDSRLAEKATQTNEVIQKVMLPALQAIMAISNPDIRFQVFRYFVFGEKSLGIDPESLLRERYSGVDPGAMRLSFEAVLGEEGDWVRLMRPSK